VYRSAFFSKFFSAQGGGNVTGTGDKEPASDKLYSYLVFHTYTQTL